MESDLYLTDESLLYWSRRKYLVQTPINNIRKKDNFLPPQRFRTTNQSKKLVKMNKLYNINYDNIIYDDDEESINNNDSFASIVDKVSNNNNNNSILSSLSSSGSGKHHFKRQNSTNSINSTSTTSSINSSFSSSSSSLPIHYTKVLENVGVDIEKVKETKINFFNKNKLNYSQLELENNNNHTNNSNQNYSIDISQFSNVIPNDSSSVSSNTSSSSSTSTTSLLAKKLNPKNKFKAAAKLVVGAVAADNRLMEKKLEWKEENHYGIKLWINKKNGTVVETCPYESPLFYPTLTKVLNKQKLTNQNNLNQDENLGTGSLVYDHSEFDDLIKLLDNAK